tara:strand:- start:3440 stop:5338 length:1899 start_codon:yes stop_codon:yes gene_type:complete
MNLDQIIITLLIILTFALFIYGKWRYDIVSIISLFLLVALDKISGGKESNLIVDASDVFNGFGHPAVVTVAAVLIISRALRNSGVVDMIALKVKPFTKNKILHISSLSSVIALLSAFMNNVGALALMLPVTLKTAWDQKRSPGVLLMPIAFASILGGMITMIGTPPNIIIANIRKDQMQKIQSKAIADENSMAAQYIRDIGHTIDTFEPSSFGLFDFAPVGASIALIGILFVAFIGWRLIPLISRKKPTSQSLFSIDDYVTEISIPHDSLFVNKTIDEVNTITGDKLTLFRKIGKTGKATRFRLKHKIKAGEQFLVMSDPSDLKEMMIEYKFELGREIKKRIELIKDGGGTMEEVVVSPESSLVGRKRSYFRWRTSNSLTLMAVARQNKPLHNCFGNMTFRVGDVLLIQGRQEDMGSNVSLLNLLPLAKRELNIGMISKAGYASLIFLGAISLSVFNIFPTTISFMLAILAYIFSGLLPSRDLYKGIDWPIIVMLGAMIPLSNALVTTGTTELIASKVSEVTSSLPIWMILSLIMIITMCLSDIINNAATALIMAPISVGIAMKTGVSIDPFLMAVAVGASCAFLTPIGHQCNALILGPGGYKFGDYWRMGLPLEIIIVSIATPLILYFWPF